MGIFKKKKQKEEEVGESEEKVGQKKVFKKKDFKDLGSENKRKRREPKKPWGRPERMVVFTLLMLTAGVSAYLWLTSIGWSFSKLINFKFNAPNIMKEETIIIENDSGY